MTGRRARVGGIAGSCRKDGYIKIRTDNKAYFAHRLAFLYMEGYFPEYSVDHKNRDASDNRWGNLRHVTQGCNLQNKKVRSDNKSGFTGVDWNNLTKNFRAQMAVDGVHIGLGEWDSALEAALAKLTCEVWHEGWVCSYQSELVKRIKITWPGFNGRCLN